MMTPAQNNQDLIDSFTASENRRPQPTFLDALANVKHPFIVGHVTPDADAIGSALGLATLFREQGKDATVGFPADCIAKRLRFMLNLAPEIRIANAWDPNGGWDAFIVVDTAAAKRINIAPVPELEGDVLTINIDHHITNTDYARYNWVDPHASSTSELIARLITRLGRRPSAETASLLYAGIHGDTAGFSLPSTSALTLHVAAGLVQAGADVSHIGEELCRSQGKPDFELLRRVYDHTVVEDEGRIAYSQLSYADITDSGCTADDIDDQVSIPRALKGVQIAMLFTEGEPGVVRINLRGEGKLSILELAKRFGGGGHTQSAGVKLHDTTLDKVIPEVVEAAKDHLRTANVG